MSERSEMINWIRSELVGPSRPLAEPALVEFNNREYADPIPLRRGPLAWRPDPDGDLQEVLYFESESPHRKYGAGLLHPATAPATTPPPDQAALEATDTIGAEPEADDMQDDAPDGTAPGGGDDADGPAVAGGDTGFDASDDFEVTSPDVRHPSTIGISICVRLEVNSHIVVLLPQSRRFSWQAEESPPFPLNGRYELCMRRWTDGNGRGREARIWRRLPALLSDAEMTVGRSELVSGQVIRKDVTMPEGSPLTLRLEIFPRQIQGHINIWLLTVVLRNSTAPSHMRQPLESVLYQTFFEVKVAGGQFEKYPESLRPFAQLDPEEQSLSLLYREFATWGIGHGCAAGWDAEPSGTPLTIYSDVMPAVQLPSMTPDIEADGRPVQLYMRSLSALSDDGAGPAWQSLENLASGYAAWIQLMREEAAGLSANFASVAKRHLEACNVCLTRINTGIALLRNDASVRRAFRLANLAILLQQIASKQLARRPLGWNAGLRLMTPQGDHRSPWSIYENSLEDTVQLGSWRAFQIAFLLMSLDGARDGRSVDREIVDLIWFPTGGGKTEAYLAVMAFYMFHERLVMNASGDEPRNDGTNVLMRYTLRMLTTQQFQRAASLICAMEYLRRNPQHHGMGDIPGRHFSLGLWIGSDGSPNTIRVARTEVAEFRRGAVEGNPLVLTECPWCRAEIGRYDGPKPSVRPRLSEINWNALRTRGIADDDPAEGPRLRCPDDCFFGGEFDYLPIEVIDERIYKHPPSLVIATADKLAIIAYRPAAGALFGRRFVDGQLYQESIPPGMIIQDELHLISGPLGTMYALYETVFERLCSYERNGAWIKPKVIASTATIRGAADQVKALYARSQIQLFPSPGLMMGDSFFGKYARDAAGKLREGHLYLGIHASDYGSVLTTQVRAFSSALFRPFSFAPECRDPWWTLLVFYNSIRELGGARTLFDSDIRSRLKFMFNREGFAHDDRRNLRIVEELTSRLSQAEIIRMMDQLSSPYAATYVSKTIDACLASNIIEVGVDIDRLSLMGVVGQPKTTATYIQVTGRVGRRWWERPGLILMIYNPSKSRDRSHFEQFHSYHRRLYERVEPTTATPFALSAIQRGSPGALIAWARQHSGAPVQNNAAYAAAIEAGYILLRARCSEVQTQEDQARSLAELERVRDVLEWKWGQNPQAWEDFPPNVNGEYLMLWPGQFATWLQKYRGVVVPSSMRQVDRSAELNITQGYVAGAMPAHQSTDKQTAALTNP
jgi:hypothetical protein